ncbi:hypothetical protein ACR79T_10240 [Sphingobacterium spiritivorum]|uniref:hypothetical protein n=1 Tax=Sphingobacterium spiritivorum TaxID=258 RepID=UPI003DA54330
MYQLKQTQRMLIGLMKYLVPQIKRNFKEVIVGILLIYFVYTQMSEMLGIAREEKKENVALDNCVEEKKLLLVELKDTRETLLNIVAQSKYQERQTSQNDSLIRKQNEKEIKQVMP